MATRSRTSSSSSKRKRPAAKTTQTDADRAADARRYERDKEKRIAAETKYKKKIAKTPAGKAKIKARAKVNNAVRDGRMEKPAGKNDFHHEQYGSGEGAPKGHWEKQAPHRQRPNTGKTRAKRPSAKKK